MEYKIWPWAFKWRQQSIFTGNSENDREINQETLSSLWVDTQQIDEKVENDIQEFNSKQYSLDDFRNIVENIAKWEKVSLEEAYKMWINFARQKWYTIEWIDIDKELEQLWVYEPQTEDIISQPVEEEKTLWEKISDFGRSIKFEWSEKFWVWQSVIDNLTAFANLPWDTVEWIWDLVDLISHPLDTIKSFNELWKAVTGKAVYSVLNKITWEDRKMPWKSEEIVNALWEELKKNFGTPWKAKKTLIENPVDTLFFLKWALTNVWKATKIKKLVDIADKIDPIKLQTKPVGTALKWVKNLWTEWLWKLTWLGKEWVEDIIKLAKTEEFWKTFKWEKEAVDIVHDVSEAINKMKWEASVKFWKDLDRVLKQWNVKVNFENKIDDFVNKLKEDYWVEVKKTKTGNYVIKEWPNTTLIEEDVNALKNIVKRLNKKKWELTWVEARNLINRIWEESKKLQHKWVLLDFKKELTNELENISPWFKKMNRDYRKMMNTVKNLQDTFGSQDIKLETKINKLNMALRDNQDYKKYMLKVIEEASWKNIKWQLAWVAARQWLPRGLIWQIWIGSAAAAITSWVNIIPVLSSLSLASPRLLWTVARTLWIWADKLKGAINNLAKNVPWWIKGVPVKETLRTWVKGAWTVEPILDTTNNK